jgi:nicotinate-nucleotide adenylyltransferase
MTAARIGLLGGSFDPPHLAHLALGQLAVEALDLDELRWLPAAAPWQKAGQALTLAEHRAGMVAALIEGEPRFVLEPCELRRGGPTYTIDTVRELQAQAAASGAPPADWFLVIGQDQYARFDTWRDWPELLRRVTLAVAARHGEAPQPPVALAAQAHRMQPLALPRQDISASDIRTRLAAGTDVTALVGERVARYIARHRLYTQGIRS